MIRRYQSTVLIFLFILSILIYYFHHQFTKQDFSELTGNYSGSNRYPPYHLPKEEDEPKPIPKVMKEEEIIKKLPSTSLPKIRPLSIQHSSEYKSNNKIPNPDYLYSQLLPGLRWLSAQKVLSYEASLMVETYAGRCPQTQLQSNLDQLKGDGEKWKVMENDQLVKERNNVIDKVIKVFGFESESKNDKFDTKGQVVSTLKAEEWDSLFGNGGRGIVYTAGNKDTTSRLLTSLKVLRGLGCTLPVEIWGFKDEINSLGEIRGTIEGQGNVKFKELTFSQTQPGAWKQFQVKGEAIARSSFSEVLYLDSDNIAVRDPTFLFDTPLYKENGIVLWPDITKDSAANPIWRILRQPCSPHEWQVETGQLLISKLARGGLNLAALMIAEEMNVAHEFWYTMSGGDKDTFRYAFHFLAIPYSPAPHFSSLAGSVIPAFEGHTFCGNSILHFGLSPLEWSELKPKLDSDYTTPNHAPPLFVHANLLKHSGYNNQRGNTFTSIKSASPDLVGPTTSTLLMNDIRGRVYNHRGMCTDLWDANSSAKEALTPLEEGGYDKGRTEIINWNESWGGLLRGFEDSYYDNGGTAGAW